MRRHVKLAVGLLLSGVVLFAGSLVGQMKPSTATKKSEPIPAPVDDGKDEVVESITDNAPDLSNVNAESFDAFHDIGFKQYVDVVELGNAISTSNHNLLTDLAIQLLEGERVLLRKHRSGVTASSLLIHLAARTPIKDDQQAMERIIRAAERAKDVELTEKLKALESSSAGSRNAKKVISGETVDDELAESVERMIREGVLTRDRELMKWFAERLPEMEGLSEPHRKYLTSLVKDSEAEISTAGDSDVTALAALAMTSRSLTGGVSLGDGWNRNLTNLSRFGLYKQPDGISCGPTCCSMVLKYYGKSAGIGPLKTKAGTRIFVYRDYNVGMTHPLGIENALEAYGVSATISKGTTASLVNYINQNRPPILLVRSGSSTWHYIAVVGYIDNGARFKIADPATGTIRNLSAGQIEGGWTFSHDYEGNPIKSRGCRLCGADGNLGWTKCVTCSGTGKISKGPLWTKCPTCSGQGKWSKKCDLCKGSGIEPDVYRKAVETAGVSGHTLIVPDRAP